MISEAAKQLSSKYNKMESEKNEEIESLKKQLESKDIVISDLKMRLSTSMKAYNEYIGQNRASVGLERHLSFNPFVDTHDPNSVIKKVKNTSIQKTTTTI